MRVVLDIDSTNRALTGIGWYAHQLAHWLPKIQADLDLWVWNQGKVSAVNESFLTDSFDAFRPVTKKPGLKLDLPVVANLWRELQTFKQGYKLKAHTDALFHGTNFRIPGFSGPSVCTVHDLSVYRFPEYHPRQRVGLIKKSIEYATGHASHFITVSEFSKREMIDVLGIPQSKISVTPLASRQQFRPRYKSETAPILAKYGLKHDQYTLFTGTIEPRKNIETLLRAYERLEQNSRDATPLVIIGGPGWLSHSTHQKMEKHQSEGWLRYLGYVSEADLPMLYSGARLFVFPSVYEGFGLPVLEAMSSGVPVVASNKGSLPEVMGTAAKSFDPHDVQKLQYDIEEINENKPLREQMIREGLSHSAEYSWEKSARLTYQAYAQAKG